MINHKTGKVYYFSIDYGVNTTQHLFCIPLIEEKFQHQIDLFTDNEFSNKGIAILYKKTKFNQKPKELELGFLTKNIVQLRLRN
jgi:hypothetical protein